MGNYMSGFPGGGGGGVGDQNGFTGSATRGLLGKAVSTGAYVANYGLHPWEEEHLKLFYAQNASRGQLLDLSDFIRLYTIMNPGADSASIYRVAARTFAAADSSRTGRITFDDYLRAYILSKSENLSPNLTRVTGMMPQTQASMMVQTPLMTQPTLMTQPGMIMPTTGLMNPYSFSNFTSPQMQTFAAYQPVLY